MFLSADDLATLTGVVRPSAQARWLSRAGMRYAISADGQVRVLRAEVERYLLSGPVKPREPALRLVIQHPWDYDTRRVRESLGDE